MQLGSWLSVLCFDYAKVSIWTKLWIASFYVQRFLVLVDCILKMAETLSLHMYNTQAKYFGMYMAINKCIYFNVSIFYVLKYIMQAFDGSVKERARVVSDSNSLSRMPEMGIRRKLKRSSKPISIKKYTSMNTYVQTKHWLVHKHTHTHNQTAVGSSKIKNTKRKRKEVKESSLAVILSQSLWNWRKKKN